MFSIDRLEDGYAVCEEEGTQFFLNRALLPKDVKEGDLIEEKDGKYFVCREETESLRKQNHDLFSALFE